MLKVLIVEDDPMVAELNKQYIEKIAGFEFSGIAANTEEAIRHLAETDVDLMLLDVYMPGLNGIDFLQQIREKKQDIDVILITAASQIDQIQQSLRLGAIDYLIKPFEYERFQEALLQYKNHHSKLQGKNKVNQQELDHFLRKKEQTDPTDKTAPKKLPKGLTKNTLQTIQQVILTKAPEAFSTEEIAEATKVSRVSVRKYLKFLSEINYLEEHLVYGVGRPIYQYQLNEDCQDQIEPYL